MKIFPSLALLIGLGGAAAVAQGFLPWQQPSGDQITGQVLNCATGVGRIAVPCGTSANPLVTSGAGAGGSTITGITRTRFTCTLPAYAAGGNVVCTDQAGQQMTTACAANTACLISAANANRKTATFQVKTAGVTVDIGYAATVAPASGIGLDGPAVAGGGSATSSEVPAHVGTYYVASPAASTIVMVQGQ